MNEPAQEGTGRQYYGLGAKLASVQQFDPRHGLRFDQEVVDFPLNDAQPRLSRKRLLHEAAIELAVHLRSGPAHSRTLAPVEQAELDTGFVGNPAHQTIQSIDLAHEMTLAQPANGGIAAHLADGGEFVRDESRTGANSGSSSRCLAPGMPAADNYDIEFVHAGPISQCFT